MRGIVLVACFALAVATPVTGAPHSHAVAAQGVAVTAPAAWRRVVAASPGSITDPRTLLVVGTQGVAPRMSVCQIASYRVQPAGAVVVIVGWKKATSAAGTGRKPLRALRSVRRPSFECFAGRGAATQVVLGGHVYQVNVMVGDRASRATIAAALAVGRSFRLAR